MDPHDPQREQSVDESLPGRIGSYRLDRLIGRGGMADVFRGYDERLDRPVALKRIRQEAALERDARERFRREARAVAQLNHGNIVQVYDWVETDGGAWIVMELVTGETLRRELEERRFNAERAVRIIRQIVGGLAAAHAAGIVHRDLKPSNVMLTPDGVKILDFGLAKLSVAQPSEEEESLTAHGSILGTVSYMSPEQARGSSVDHRSDLFAIGTLLYEMVTGSHPFHAEQPAQTLTRICTWAQTPARQLTSSVSPALSSLIDRLLAKEPVERPQSAGEVIALLDESSVVKDGRAGALDTTIEAPYLADSHPGSGSRSFAERRQVTVLSCELVGDALASQDLDSLIEAVPRFQALAKTAVSRFDGHLGPVIGHRLLAYFGYPRVHEDDARRAVHAALELVARVGEPTEGADPGLSVRLAVHTGPALVMPVDEGSEELALGRTLELATGIRSHAESGCVLVSGTTRELIEGCFELETLAPARLPGMEQAFSLHRVCKVYGAGADRAMLQTPLVGRERELELLEDRWRTVGAGSGQVVLISGEPGIGKSRLTKALAERIGEEHCRVAYCSAYAEGSPWHPIIELLRQLFDLDPGAAGSEAVDRLAPILSERGFEPTHAVPLLSPVLSLPVDERYPSPALSPEKLRAETQEALAALLLTQAEPEPAVLVIEDLHWVDPSTRELIGLVIEQIATVRLLLVLTFRNEFFVPWPHRAGLTQLALNSLGGREVETLIHRVTGGKSLPVEVSEQILDKTDGVPLFVEELTRSLLESDLLVAGPDGYRLVESLEPLAIPRRLRDTLAARLDHLGEAKQVAQLAATIGRAVSHRLLAAVSSLEPSALRASVDRLLAAEILYRRGFASRASYIFKHALIQDAAYGSLIARERRRLHGEIARVMETDLPEMAQTRPDLMAHHLTEAGRPARASSYRLRAGQLAVERSAHQEAIDQLESGLALVDSITDDRQRADQERSLLTVLAPIYMAVKGFVAPETEAAYLRAYELGQHMEQNSHLFANLYGIWQFHNPRSEAEKARKTAEEMLDLARRLNQPPLIAASFRALGESAFWAGDLPASRRLLERGIAIYNSDHPQPPGMDPGVLSLGFRAWGLCYLGFPDQALATAREALGLAERLSQPFAMGYGLFFNTIVHQARREAAVACEWSEKALELAREHGFSYLQVQIKVMHGWALAQMGQEDEGVATLQWCIERAVPLGHSWQRLILAECWQRRGNSAAALAEVESGLAAAKASGNRLWESGLRHLEGTLKAELGAPVAEVEACLRRAVAVARRQRARSVELRAVVSLARVLREQRRDAEARETLAEIYGFFTEGFDTLDLREARALLEVVGGEDDRPRHTLETGGSTR